MYFGSIEKLLIPGRDGDTVPVCLLPEPPRPVFEEGRSARDRRLSTIWKKAKGQTFIHP